jgi:ribosomal protein S18 acetylase RimI-like enzyme
LLTPDLAGRIRLPLTSRFTARSLAEHARLYPGMGLLADEGRQYIVAAPWRHRSEVAELVEVSRGNLRSYLVERLGEVLVDSGVKLLVLDYGLGALEPRFFRAEGFDLIERIIELERPDQPVDRIRAPGLAIHRYHAGDREAVLELERESFPWLWWNSPEEWESYTAAKEVEVVVGRVDRRVVGYAGFVVYGREGHLDRLAVREGEQGKGFGASLLSVSIERMRERGAKRISLTTQETNVRSQALYFRNGFRRSRWTYEIHGKWLDEANGPPGPGLDHGDEDEDR